MVAHTSRFHQKKLLKKYCNTVVNFFVVLFLIKMDNPALDVETDQAKIHAENKASVENRNASILRRFQLLFEQQYTDEFKQKLRKDRRTGRAITRQLRDKYLTLERELQSLQASETEQKKPFKLASR